jgi:hypothetical protein
MHQKQPPANTAVASLALADSETPARTLQITITAGRCLFNVLIVFPLVVTASARWFRV